MISAIVRLLSWNVAAQAILLSTMPFLPHLYSPSAFTEYAVFSSAALLFGQCVSLRLPEALRFETDQASIIAASLLLSIALSLLIIPFSPFLAAATAAIALYNLVFNVLADRQQYTPAGRLRLIRAVTLALGQLGLFTVPNGLMIAYFGGHALPAALHARDLWHIQWPSILPILRKYAVFGVERTLSAAVLFGSQLTPLLAARHAYSDAAIASFALSDKLVGALCALLTLSIETVAYRELEPRTVRTHRYRIGLAYLMALVLTLPAIAITASGVADALFPADWNELPRTLAITLPTMPALVMTSFAIRILTLLRRTRLALVVSALMLVARTGPFLLGVDQSSALALFAGLNVAAGFGAYLWMVMAAPRR